MVFLMVVNSRWRNFSYCSCTVALYCDWFWARCQAQPTVVTKPAAMTVEAELLSWGDVGTVGPILLYIHGVLMVVNSRWRNFSHCSCTLLGLAFGPSSGTTYSGHNAGGIDGRGGTFVVGRVATVGPILLYLLYIHGVLMVVNSRWRNFSHCSCTLLGLAFGPSSGTTYSGHNAGGIDGRGGTFVVGRVATVGPILLYLMCIHDVFAGREQ